MIDKKIMELIFSDPETDLTAEERLKLQDYLAADPDAAKFYTEWQNVKAEFDREKLNMVDVDLKQAILERINMEKYVKKEVQPGIKFTVSFWRRPAFRFAFVFILGVFTGILLFSFLKVDFSGKKLPTQDMKGTLYDSRSYNDMKVADNILYDSPLARAVFAVRYSTKVVEIRIDLSSLYPIKTTIEFDFNNFECLNVQNVLVNDQTTCSAAANFVQINNVGDNKFIIQLYNKNSLQHNIDFKIFQNDMPLYQNSVVVNKE